MGLNIKKFNDVLQDMAVWVTSNSSKLTNMRVGSVTRTMLEAVAVEIESLYYEAKRGFNYAIENSIYNSFSFNRRPAIPASGNITLLFRKPIIQKFYVPVGSVYFTVPVDGEVLRYVTTEEVFAIEGSTSLEVPVKCETPGIIGNIPPFTIRRAVNPSPLIQDIYNQARFFNGMPEETKESRKKRFSDYVDSLGKGTTASLLYGCSQVEGIVGVSIKDEIGVVRIYAHGKDGLLTDTQRNDIISILPEYKCAGVKAIVSETVTRNVDLYMNVTLSPEYDKLSYRESIQSSVVAYLNSFKVGKLLIKADLIRFIMGIDELAIVNVELDLEEDVIIQSYELIRPRDISIDVME